MARSLERSRYSLYSGYYRRDITWTAPHSRHEKTFSLSFILLLLPLLFLLLLQPSSRSIRAYKYAYREEFAEEDANHASWCIMRIETDAAANVPEWRLVRVACAE